VILRDKGKEEEGSGVGKCGERVMFGKNTNQNQKINKNIHHKKGDHKIIQGETTDFLKEVQRQGDQMMVCVKRIFC